MFRMEELLKKPVSSSQLKIAEIILFLMAKTKIGRSIWSF